MKITLQIPDRLLCRAKEQSDRDGISLHRLVADALAEKLGPEPLTPEESRAARMKWAGALSHLREETARINAIIEEEFERLD